MLTTFLIIAAVLAALTVSRFYMIGDTPARHQARADYDQVKAQNPEDPLVSVDRDTFVAIHETVRVRRFWQHFAIFAGLAIGFNLILFSILQAVWRFVDPGFYVWGFIAFFTTIALAVAAFFITMRLYTRGRLDAMRKAIEAHKQSGTAL
ncbi:MAG: hypothetical protein EP347_04975 [Alphaproteobacteria bacterium]|nr:MAG: hypothetical protein EP347_04975 [Alphaproteobacteria bacterium]